MPHPSTVLNTQPLTVHRSQALEKACAGRQVFVLPAFEPRLLVHSKLLSKGHDIADKAAQGGGHWAAVHNCSSSYWAVVPHGVYELGLGSWETASQ